MRLLAKSTPHCKQLSKVARIISEEIDVRGAISFARFMELALYCPDFGYYEAEEDRIGRGGDFYTSVSVGSVFGELLAWQFAEWLSPLEHARTSLRRPENAPVKERGLSLVEGGAHNGKLAKDILSWLRAERESLYQQINYYIIEPSARRTSWQKQQLLEFSERVHWVTSLDAFKSCHPGVDGIIFANELLDSFPVHRYGRNEETGEWFEWGVTVEKGEFVWTRLLNQQLDFVPMVPKEYSTQEFVHSPQAEHWWSDAAQLLHCGKVLTFDYGFLEEEQAKEAGTQGTIRGYHKHQLTSDILANPGEQDLTAHVNFSNLQRIGEKAGLRTETIETQERFLSKLLSQAWNDKAVSGKWTAGQSRQFQTLIHPEHLGTRFRVLLQGRS